MSDLAGMQPLVFSKVTMSADEYVAVNFRLWRQQPATRRNNWILLAALVLLTISLLVQLQQDGWKLTSWSALSFLAVGLLYALLRAWFVRWMLRRGYLKNTILKEPIDFTLTDEDIKGRSGLGQFTGKLANITRAVFVQPDWLLLYPTQAACYYLNLRQLQAPATAEAVEQVLAQHQIPVRRV
ncbi:hypothetical protein HMJ29_12380 [Hymenobacter taeanensis]|uniref:YcxB family protein n=1 Tax=Hymenobacter taeanensis TaxID=2735321 RepID=A0A6M6BIS9_9BACT|nr:MULTISPECIES: hypothetical protein [Hymenobacter]QJX47694.1 hypothetical protein HMJ29_12380 [Hymenobacter taeanensis]UOQ82821.1 hypothetical protein MUN83_08690 [Hymenobacter sp. 5414T-23]